MTDEPEMTSEGMEVPGSVDQIERLHRDPPVKWNNETLWAIMERDGELILREYARIPCPTCGETATWAKGIVGCKHCMQRRPLRG